MRWGALALALVLALLVAPGAGVSKTAKPRFGGTVVVWQPSGPAAPACLGVVAPCAAGSIEVIPAFESIVGLVLEGAFEVGPDLTYRPNLVSRVTVRKRPFTVTYKIRRGARAGLTGRRSPPMTSSSLTSCSDPSLNCPRRRR
jgi:hypothetical protein